MSDIHNHLLCGQFVKEEANQHLNELIQQYRSIFYLGCLGGDIFYYFRFMNKKANRWASRIGSLFHQDVNQIFSDAKDYYRKANPKDKDAIMVYLFGFITHHALDSNTHPFINHFSVAKYSSKRSNPYLHKRFEVALDVMHADYRRETLFPIKELLDIKNDYLSLVSGLFQHLLSARNEILIPDDMLEGCVADLRKLMRISKSKSTYLLMRFIDFIGNEIKFCRPFFYLSTREKSFDALNINHDFWVNPYDCSVKSNLSYPELFHYAKNDASNRIKMYFQYLHEQNNSIDHIFAGQRF